MFPEFLFVFKLVLIFQENDTFLTIFLPLVHSSYLFFFALSPSPENGGAKGCGSGTLGVGEILFRSDASLPGGMHLGCTWVTTYFLHSRREFRITSTASSAPTYACFATFLADRLGDNFRNGTPAVSQGEILLILLLVAIFLRTTAS